MKKVKLSIKCHKEIEKELDEVFSKFIRARDKRCCRCGSPKRLTASHYWSRRHKSTRFDEDNVIALCFPCHIHQWEKEKQGDYKIYMTRRLGEQKMQLLEMKARSIAKYSAGEMLCMLQYYQKKLEVMK